MVLELKDDKSRYGGNSPYACYLGKNVVFTTHSQTIVGRLEKITGLSDTAGLPSLVFRPVIIYDGDDRAHVSDRPIICTYMDGIMRPLLFNLKKTARERNKALDREKAKQSP